MSKLIVVLAFVAAVCLGSHAEQHEMETGRPSTSPTVAERAASSASRSVYQAVHAAALVIDTHADTPARFIDENFDPSTDSGRGHWDLNKAKKANLGAQFFSIYVEPEKNKGHYARRAQDLINSVYRTVAAHPDDMIMAFSPTDILAARNAPHKRIAILLGIEGGHAIEGNIRLLQDFYRQGVRYMTLTWANSNELAQSSGDLKENDETGEPRDPGLTEFGRKVVQEMNRMGMMVDLSHVSDQSFYDAVSVSRAPVLVSHSSARALADAPRNLTDEMLIALARNGGVADVNFNCAFIDQHYLDAFRKLQEKKGAELDAIEERHASGAISYNEYMRAVQNWSISISRPPLKSLIDNIDHMVKVAGINHVGIGSDFDGVPCLPQGVDSVADLPKITRALVQRGYSGAAVQKILGGNLLRLFAQVEQVSLDIQYGVPERQKASLPSIQNPAKP